MIDWVVLEGIIIDSDILVIFLDGGYYVNVYMLEYVGGEICG